MISTPGTDESETCLILVDYDNAFPPNLELSDEEISLEVAQWLRRLSDHDPLIDRFEVRLYGGWYDDRDLSRHGSEVVRVMTTMPEFPMSVSGGRILRGSISLAVNPLASTAAAPLLGTYRRRGSLPRIRLTRHPYPESCAQVDPGCPAAILRSFTKGGQRQCPVDACSLVARDAFVVHEQKMVDTMLATDILTAGQLSSAYSTVVVVSGDSDFLPPLLAAHQTGGASLVQLVPRQDESSEYATAVLADIGVKIL